MMDLIVQPDLVERAVFEAARRDNALRPHYERQFADCYDYRPGERRDRAFARLHERWFDELELRDRIAEAVAEFPHFLARVGRLVVARAPTPRSQSVELFGSPDQYTVAVAVAPSTLLDRPAFECWARHEFMHVDDMLDPAFGFNDALRPSGATTAVRNLVRDRYAVLWAMCVDARLASRGRMPDEARARREKELIRVFALEDSEATRRALSARWDAGEWLKPTHALLLSWAQGGVPELCMFGARNGTKRSCQGGAPCPLCGFPTFDWMTDAAELGAIRDAVRMEVPQWRPTQPICRRCAEVYRVGAPVACASTG